MQFVSDLHLESIFPKLASPKFSHWYQCLIQNRTGRKYLALAGDIGNLTNNNLEYFLRELSNGPYKKIFYVAGNHEFYNGDRTPLNISEIKFQIRTLCDYYGIDFLDNEVRDINVNNQKVRILGTTLWSNINMDVAMNQKRFGDLQYIYHENKPLEPKQLLQMHHDSVDFLNSEIKSYLKPTKLCVLSHHLPSYQCIDPLYAESDVTSFFASDLEHLIPMVNVWIHGHTHHVVNKKINGCIVRSNPRAYKLDPIGFKWDAAVLD